MTPSKHATRQAAHVFNAVFLRTLGSIEEKQIAARAAWQHVRRTADLPPPTPAETARLVAEFCAKRGVVVCRTTPTVLPQWVQDIQDALPGGDCDLT